MDVFFIILCFIIGTVMGSFYNVVIYRVPECKSIIKPRSSCGDCGKILEPFDLIPVFSYIFLKGKCRYCKQPISLQYPLVELLTGLLFVFLYLRFSISVEFIFSVYISSILLIVFFIDLKHMIIPNGLVVAALIGSSILFILRFFYDDSIIVGEPWYFPLLGMVIPSVFLLLVAIFGYIANKGEAMGMGDVKIFAPIGLFLGLKLSVLALFLSMLIGGLAGLILIVAGIKERKSQVPFGPFIVAGSLLSLFYGNEILTWYFSIL
ncbi:MAG: prepilin peptidase [Clostridiaceae bacterium]|jgi:leader peptidase (prepilin peptidase)/N-methyltransferase|nr:prepilin peptidase [Clostridiaceae bacterium]